MRKSFNFAGIRAGGRSAERGIRERTAVGPGRRRFAVQSGERTIRGVLVAERYLAAIKGSQKKTKRRNAERLKASTVKRTFPPDCPQNSRSFLV